MPKKFSIHIPPIVRPRSSQDTHSFQRLRSFYLTPSPTKAQFDVTSLTSAANASLDPSPVSAHFPAGISPQSSGTTAGDACSERTLRAVRSMDSVGQAKVHGDAKRAKSGQDAGSSDPRGGSWTIRRPRNPKCRGAAIMLGIIALSLFLVICLSLAFLGANSSDAYFKKALDKVASADPGIVLVGESVDVDIDEPSVDIRWSILACGGGFVLPGSEGVLGSAECGLPIEPLQIFVDSEPNPAATYDPTLIPYQRSTGHRRTIESLTRFTTTHVLDVHKTRLYPFDGYKLTGSLRAARVSASAAAANGSTSSGGDGPRVEDAVRISRVLTQGTTSNFDIETKDVESFLQADAAPGFVTSSSSSLPVPSQSPSSAVSYTGATSTSHTSTPTPSSTSLPERRRAESGGGLSSIISPQTPFPSRDFDMHITRPASAQTFVLLMFALSWVLVHVSVTISFLAWRKRRRGGKSNEGLECCSGQVAETDSKTTTTCYALLSVAVLGAILGMRQSMPDAPGFDGVLLDCIGFFPQVIIAGVCVLALLFTIGAREIDAGGVSLPCENSQDCESNLASAGHCICPAGFAREKEPQCNVPRPRTVRPSHPRGHATDSSESSDSSTTTNPDHTVQYAHRCCDYVQPPFAKCNCKRQSLISAFPPPPGFRRSQSLSSSGVPFSPTSSSSFVSLPMSPRVGGASTRGGVSRLGQCNAHHQHHHHTCTSSHGSSSSAGADIGHWHFPTHTLNSPTSVHTVNSPTSMHSEALPVSPTRTPSSDIERGRVMSPSPKIPRSPLGPPLSPTSAVGFASGCAGSTVVLVSPTSPTPPVSPTSPTTPTSPTSPTSPTTSTTSLSGRKKFAFALGSVFGGSPSPPSSPTSKLGFSISTPSLKRDRERERGVGAGTPRKGSSASLGMSERKGCKSRSGSGSLVRNGLPSQDVELEMRRSAKRRESGVGHRRVRTASVVREGEEREVSRWSDHEDD